MVTADLLADWSNYVVVHDHYTSDLIRFVIATVSGLTAVLLLRLYLSHRTGRMNRLAGLGATLTYSVVAWAQIVAIKAPVNDLTALNFGVLLAVSLSLTGTLQAMDVFLFRKERPPPSRAQAQADEINRIGKLLDSRTDTIDSIDSEVDEIDRAVNTRPEGSPTISEDVRQIAQRMEDDD